jgi:hypothetical protein
MQFNTRLSKNLEFENDEVTAEKIILRREKILEEIE